MWKNIVETVRPQVTIWHMRTACWTPKATTKSSEYVILIACPMQQWLHERVPKLRYRYIGAHAKENRATCAKSGCCYYR